MNILSFMSHSPLNQEIREKTVQLLQPILSDLILLQLALKQAHWNIRGKLFLPLHELFDRLASEIYEQVDEVGERIVALGGRACGTVSSVTQNTSLKDFSTNLSKDSELIKSIHELFVSIGKTVLKGIDLTAQQGDMGTSDLLTGLGRALDKNIWMLEAHLDNQ